EFPHVGARADQFALVVAIQHGAAGDRDRRNVTAGSSHHQGWGGLVAAHQEYDAIDGIAADRLLHIHGGKIAEEHRGGAEVGLTTGEDRELQREAAGLVDAPLDVLRDLAEVVVAGCQFRKGIADADHRSSIEEVIGKALISHPASVQKGVLEAAVEPGLATQFDDSNSWFPPARGEATAATAAWSWRMMMSSTASLASVQYPAAMASARRRCRFRGSFQKGFMCELAAKLCARAPDTA